jgi:hypothetical protein
MRIRHEDEDAFFQFLEFFAGRVILIANDLAQQVNELTDSRHSADSAHDFRHFRYLPFGHVRRSELIERWLLLNPAASENEELLAQQLLSIERLMNTIIGKNFVPAFPVFLLAILQGHESGAQMDVNASTYGYFYELFVRNSLATGTTKVQFDIKIAYLSFLAYELLPLGDSGFSVDDVKSVHRKYEVTYAIELPFESFLDELTRGGIFLRIEESLWFRYQYVFYYFVANYLKDHITEDGIRDVIRRLSTELHIETSANILIFLTHLSKDPFIIEQMVSAAATHFEGASVANLREDVAFLTAPDPSALKVEYEEKDLRAVRGERLRALDEVDAERAVGESASQEANTVGIAAPQSEDSVNEEFEILTELIGKLTAALKNLQILGQILKNFPGSLPGERKQQIATECYNVGLRVLSSMLSLMAENRSELVLHYMEALREEDPRADFAEIYRTAREHMFVLAHMMTHGIVKRISVAVGSNSLRETYKAIRAESGTAAVRLIDMSIRLDQFAGFPEQDVLRLGAEFEGQLLPHTVLRHLIVNHFHLFPVHFQVKQSVCDRLGITYKRLQAANPSVKLLPRGADGG